MPENPITSRQKAVLDFVQAHHRQHGHHPTVREIQAHFGFASPFAATRHLHALERKGILTRVAGKARAFLPGARRTPRGAIVDIPVYGVIPAGSPAANEQQADEHVAVDLGALGLRSTTRLFALRVRGDSMTGAGIVDGDLVFLSQRGPRPGDIVAALIDGESTLKRFLIQRGRPFLHAENPRYPDLIPASELLIQGVMTGLLRSSSK